MQQSVSLKYVLLSTPGDLIPLGSTPATSGRGGLDQLLHSWPLPRLREPHLPNVRLKGMTAHSSGANRSTIVWQLPRVSLTFWPHHVKSLPEFVIYYLGKMVDNNKRAEFCCLRLRRYQVCSGMGLGPWRDGLSCQAQYATSPRQSVPTLWTSLSAGSTR